jgi:hypothetical protein
MSEIYLDGEKIELSDYNNDWSLLLKQIYDKIGKMKKGIVKMIADGDDITQIISGVKLEKTPDNYNKIEVNTLDISQIAYNGINNVKKFLPNLIKILKGAAEFARLGEDDKKNEAINGSLEGIKLVITLFINIHNLYKFDINSIKLKNGDSLASQFTNLNKIFEVFNNAQQRQDNVEIADIIEYEILPAIENFDEVFDVIKGEIKDKIIM